MHNNRAVCRAAGKREPDLKKIRLSHQQHGRQLKTGSITKVVDKTLPHCVHAATDTFTGTLSLGCVFRF